MNGKAAKRIGRLSLALATALLVVASIGVASASARMWIQKQHAGFGYYFDRIHTGVDFESVDSWTSLEFFLFDETEPVINCTDGDMTVSGDAGLEVPLSQESLPFDSTFSGCSATDSNFPTTVDMGDCGLALEVGEYKAPEYYAKTRAYFECSGSQYVETTSYLGQTELCTVRLPVHSRKLEGSTTNTAEGFSLLDATTSEFMYYTEGNWCPQDGWLSGAKLRLNLDLVPAA